MCQPFQSNSHRFVFPLGTALPFRILLCALMLGCLTEFCVGQPISEDLTFPYQAIVLTEGAQVRSGPGNVHYATGQLEQNSTVEVYRHDPGGWCAIRPTEGCFSLLPESALQIVEEGVGQVSEDGTQAWVGTELGPVDKPLWQVKLKKGETVEILGQASWPNPEGHSTLWYQVSPPAGEFRWIHISDLQLPPTLDQLVSATVEQQVPDLMIAASSTNASASLPEGEIRPASYQSEVSVKTPVFPRSLNDVNRGWRQARREERTNRFNPAGELTNSFNTNAGVGANYSPLPPVDLSYPNGFSTSSAPPYAPERLASAKVDSRFDLELLNQTARQRNSSAGIADLSASALGMTNSQPLTMRLAELEFKLSNEMIKDPNQWRLIDLQTVADSIYQSTDNPLERLQAQQLLRKLESCRKIRSGYLETYQPGDALNDSGLVGSGVAIEKLISLSTTYDATGWLNELVRAGGTSQSTYVLQDDNGKITHHLSPGPGFNLHGYLKSKIGVIGQRGYHNTLNLDHVTVERVVVLESRK